MKISHLTSAMILSLSLIAGGAYGKSSTSAPTTSGPAKSPNAASTAHFAASYQNLMGGHLTCSGERIVKLLPTPFTKDSQECTMTDVSTWPANTYTGSGNPSTITVLGKNYYWRSDYDGQAAKQITYVVKKNSDGTGKISIVAYY